MLGIVPARDAKIAAISSGRVKATPPFTAPQFISPGLACSGNGPTRVMTSGSTARIAQMPHFAHTAPRTRLGLAAAGPEGLRSAQIGALLALAAHATVSTDPAQLILPTGVGKSTVAALAPYVLAAEKVLVVVPGRLIRGQIEDAFLNPTRARAAGVLPKNSALPKVEIAQHRATAKHWSKWRRNVDVVIGTPSVLSPANKGVDPMPRDLFDLVIFDEAHHLPATTWTALLAATDARAVLLTATPFRNDGKRLPGQPVYTYPLSLAIDEGVFGPVDYEPVTATDPGSRDLAIATTAVARLRTVEHREAGSRLLVRTDSVEHARELAGLYAGLDVPLSVIVHDTPWQEAVAMRQQVVDGTSQGFVCVGALTEGFDFPALKVGAYHAPHKTLGPTIQFIGRLARVGDIAGVLVAPREAITRETSELYREDVAWRTLLPDLLDSAIDRERDIRRFIEQSNIRGLLDLPALSLTPGRSVQIFLTESAPDPTAELDHIAGAEVVQRIVHDETNTVAFITRRVWRPGFTRLDVLDVPIHELHLLTWVEEQKVLFLSTTSDSARRDILDAIAPAPRSTLPALELRRLLEAAHLDRFFSLGTRAAQAQATRTSYQVRSGPKTEDDITPADGRQWDLGHGIGRSGNGTFGFSVQKSKIWEPGAADSLFSFRRWCEELATQLRDPTLGNQPSRLDLLTISNPLTAFPDDPLVAVLPSDMYVAGDRLLADGEIVLPELLEFRPRRGASTTTAAVFDLLVRDADYGEAIFQSDGRCEINGKTWIVQPPGEPGMPLQELLIHEPPTIFFADGSRAIDGRISAPQAMTAPVLADVRKPRDWTGTDITKEWGAGANGTLSVGPTIGQILVANNKFLIQDHAAGELADFIAIDDINGVVSAQLVHCKRSGRNTASVRVDELQELVAQAVRSVFWLQPGPMIWEELIDRLQNRAATQLIGGNVAELNASLAAWAASPPLTSWSIVIVQPGLANSDLDHSPRGTTLLNVAHSWAQSQNVDFEIICSA